MTLGFGMVRRGIAFVALVAVPAMPEPTPQPTDERIACGVVCRVTLGALPSGLRELLKHQQAALCEAVTAGPVRPIRGGPVRAITVSFDDLVRAFRSEESPHVIVAAATLIQLATRVAMPPCGGDVRMDENPRADSTWAGAIAGHRVRLQYEARVSPTRFHPVATIDQAVRDVMQRGQRANQRAFCAGGANKTGDKSQGTRSTGIGQEALSSEPSDRLVRELEDRIEDGALLAARLIGSAWIKSGRPTDSVNTSPQTASEATHGEYVASRYSKVFHKADCPHAKRIKPANRIRFSSPSKATAAKKKPCRTCKPG